MKRILLICVLAVCILVVIESCTKDKGTPLGYLTDEKLYLLCKDTVGHTYYQNDSSILGAAGNSPHGLFRVRFNATAQAALDTVTGKLPSGSEFPDKSLIVKEIHSSTTPLLTLYAAMYKQQGSWIWAEYKPNGETVVSILNGGNQCISCHSEGGNIDRVRLFALH